MNQPECKPKSLAIEGRVLGLMCSGERSVADGNIQLYVKDDERSASLKEGDVITVKLQYDSIINTSDTGFDASLYFGQKNIYHRAYVRQTDWWYSGELDSRNSLMRFRYRAIATIQSWNMKPHSEQVMIALILGDKRLLDKELRQRYAEAGVVHVLAVSGLHVGVIYLLVSLLLNTFLSNRQAFAKTMVVILVLWLYACLTGLSPSVWRAATMFTLLSIGRNLGRMTGIYHTISASALLLLVLDSDLLFKPGFQLSYAAVFGIVRYQPQMQDWWTPSQKWMSPVWQLLTVSLSAQIITLPFTTHYFGQFPTYFLLSNLLVIPLLSSIMIASIAVLTIGIITPLPHWLSNIIDMVYNIQNQTITHITTLPNAVVNGLETSFFQASLLLAFFISGLEMVRRRDAKWFMAWMLCSIALITIL